MPAAKILLDRDPLLPVSRAIRRLIPEPALIPPADCALRDPFAIRAESIDRRQTIFWVSQTDSRWLADRPCDAWKVFSWLSSQADVAFEAGAALDVQSERAGS